MDLTTLTFVRHWGADAYELLSGYIYGGIYTPPIVPRGIALDDVSDFIIKKVEVDDSETVYRNTLEVMRFYEKGEVLDHLLKVIKQELHSVEDVVRAAYVIQAAAEFGSDDIPEKANKYFDEVLVNHPQAVHVLPTLLETKIILAPIGTLDKLAERINSEVQKAEIAITNENTMAYYDKLAAIQRNSLPRTKNTIQGKIDILALDKLEQQSELIAVYLGQADISDFHSETWAGRLIRFDHIDGKSKPVITQLSKMLDITQTQDPIGDFIFERSARAIIYLEGELTDGQQKKYDEINKAGVHFLSDSTSI